MRPRRAMSAILTLLASLSAAAQTKKDAPPKATAAAPPADLLPLGEPVPVKQPAKQAPPQSVPALTLPTNPELTLQLLPLPDLPQLSLDAFQQRKLCVMPLPVSTSDKGMLDLAQFFVDVAEKLPADSKVKDVRIPKDPPNCGNPDSDLAMRCYADFGTRAGCETILAASVKKGRNQKQEEVLVLEATWIATKTREKLSSTTSTVDSQQSSDLAAWAEGQACAALRAKCRASLTIDADLPEMRVYLNKGLAPRNSPTSAEIVRETVPGLHSLQIKIGERPSQEKQIPVRRDSKTVVYARQTRGGGFDFQIGGAKPPRSAELEQGGWKKPVGFTVAGAGVVAAIIGGYELSHGRSQVSTADTAAGARGGVYTTSELSTLSSAHSAQRTGAALLIVSGVLIAAGATLAFAF